MSENNENRGISTAKLKVIVLLCGAAVMGLEMAGVRLLEPYMGSTIYVWGAIIGIFLAALSLGYFLGGRLADLYPKMKMLGLVIVLAALWIFAVPLASVHVSSSIVASFNDPRLEAFLAALILYAVPSVLLGMVSPFAVRLAATDVKHLGHIAGSLYAISTFGSIIGTFLVTFALTEIIGTMSITWGVGAVLLFAAILSFKGNLQKTGVVAVMLGVLACGGGWLGKTRAEALQNISSVFPADHYMRDEEGGRHLEKAESGYHLINIFEGKYDLAENVFLKRGRKARYMVFNDQIESGCIVDSEGEPVEPMETACGYVKLLHVGALVTGKAPQNVVIIGCGGGVGPQMFVEDYKESIKRIDVVDIDKKVFEMAGKYFNYPYPEEDEIIKSHVKDGRRFIADYNREEKLKWDYVVMDAYTAGGRIPKHLISKEFFEQAKERMPKDGVLVANIISAQDGEKSRLFKAVYKTMKTVYKHVYFFPRNRDQEALSNIMIVGSNHAGERLSKNNLFARLNFSRGSLIKQPLDYVVRNIPALEPNLSDAPVLTDDFCPTDSMVY